MNDAFPGERLSARIHSQLALYIEIEQRVVGLLLKSLNVSRFSNIKTHPLIIQEKIISIIIIQLFSFEIPFANQLAW